MRIGNIVTRWVLFSRFSSFRYWGICLLLSNVVDEWWPALTWPVVLGVWPEPMSHREALGSTKISEIKFLFKKHVNSGSWSSYLTRNSYRKQRQRKLTVDFGSAGYTSVESPLLDPSLTVFQSFAYASTDVTSRSLGTGTSLSDRNQNSETKRGRHFYTPMDTDLSSEVMDFLYVLYADEVNAHCCYSQTDTEVSEHQNDVTE